MERERRAFAAAVRDVISFDDGLMLVSEGDVYVRSLEGGLFVAGVLDETGGMDNELEFQSDVDSAIEYFLSEREQRGHGAPKTV